jgi:hypothetical protein
MKRCKCGRLALGTVFRFVMLLLLVLMISSAGIDPIIKSVSAGGIAIGEGKIYDWTINGPITNPANKHLYYAISRTDLIPATWTESEAKAQSLGGHLVTINDVAENKWVRETFPTGYLWIGVNDAASACIHVWASGESVTFKDFFIGEFGDGDCSSPELDYGVMNNDAASYHWFYSKNGQNYVGIVEVVPSPPNTPPLPEGLSAGYIGTSYIYSTTTTDPNNDQIKYTFDWGDGSQDITNFVNSGQASANHIWTNPGTYYVKVRATDFGGLSSVWSPSKAVTIELKPLLTVSPDPIYFNIGTLNTGEPASRLFLISNAGGGTLTWTVSDDQPWINLNPTGGTNSGTVTININTVGLSPGSYKGTISIASNGGTKGGIVYLNVLASEIDMQSKPTAVPTQLITGNISVTSSPLDAEVFVDGISKGIAPVTIPNISPSSHAVTCKLSGYVDYDTSASVTAGSTSSVICSLVKYGDLSVKLTSEPASIQPGQTSTIKITVTKDGAPVSGVNVMLSSTPNVKFSSSSGTTTNGEFISTFTTLTEGEIKVSALAKKEGITDGKGDTIVQVGKITQTPTSKQATIVGKVIDATTTDPVQDVIITVDGKSAVTGSNGEFELTADVGKHSLSARKSGYETTIRSMVVPDIGTVFDLSLEPASDDSSWFWIGIILLIVVVAAIIYLIYRKKNQKSDEKKKEKVEAKKQERKLEGAEEKKKFCMFCHLPVPLDSDFCTKCGKKQDETKRFCMSCGSLMPCVPELCGKCSKMPPSGEDTKNCRNCGEVIPVVAKFCSACGAGQPE